MKARGGLRRRIVASVVCYTVLISIATVLHGYWVNEQAEQRLWESMLQTELAQWMQRRGEQDHRWQDTEDLRMFGRAIAQPIPPEFQSLPPGVHDEVGKDGRLHVVLVDGNGPDRTVLALDITEMERRETTLSLAMLASAVLVILFLAAVTYFGAQWLLRPLTSLSSAIRGLRAGAQRQQIDIDLRDPEEIAIIAGALNEYLRSIDSFVERERAFLRMASHELRTPIAVIAGAAEVSIEQRGIEQARPHLARIQGTARNMQDLLALLLVLAKDPARLGETATAVDLAELVPRILADHEHLMQGKELTCAFGTMRSVRVVLPVPIAQAAIGNLVRNAIENSNRGVIVISVNEAGAIVIEDPGVGMSAVEASRLQARLARKGEGVGDGIGLDLIARLCEHLGWTLSLQPSAAGGTIAELNFQRARSQPSGGWVPLVAAGVRGRNECLGLTSRTSRSL